MLNKLSTKNVTSTIHQSSLTANFLSRTKNCSPLKRICHQWNTNYSPCTTKRWSCTAKRPRCTNNYPQIVHNVPPICHQHPPLIQDIKPPLPFSWTCDRHTVKSMVGLKVYCPKEVWVAAYHTTYSTSRLPFRRTACYLRLRVCPRRGFRITCDASLPRLSPLVKHAKYGKSDLQFYKFARVNSPK